MRKLTQAQWKNKVDRVFSIWVRSQGAVDGVNSCYTCGVRLPVKQLQAGHFISRTHSATRYDPRNVKPQCMPCNIWKNGMPHEFAARLLKELGGKEFNELIKLGRSTHSFTVKELEELYTKYANSEKDT